jgi:2-polyprenyl-3-methyl-5-hydroxy-6-metoxy-1,4-benzoquinol methylase
MPGMPFDERKHWNAKYAAGEGRDTEPDLLLTAACAAIRPGVALDLAGGTGRHAIWLAERGWRVTLADISNEAIALAEQRLLERSLLIPCRCEAAAETVAWAKRESLYFDLIAIFWFLERPLFSALAELVAPGGLVIYKTFTSEHIRFHGKDAPAYTLRPNELRTAFPPMETLKFREEDGVAELVARRG